MITQRGTAEVYVTERFDLRQEDAYYGLFRRVDFFVGA